MTKAPTVFCPKEGKKVPIYYCIGSFMQQTKTCPDLILATIFKGATRAEVKCKRQEKK